MLVSVIIPTFNRSDTIARTMDSVMNQSYSDIEVIVVDDGSTDETPEILRNYGGKIKVISQTNAGPSAARNAGLKIARGSIVAFLDSDDVWLPRKIERQVAVLNQGGQKMPCCICNALVSYGSSVPQRTSFENAGIQPSIENGCWTNPSEVLVTRFVLFNQVVAVRREAIAQIGGFKEEMRLLEDHDFALRLSVLGKWGIIREPLVIKYNETNGIGVQAMRNEGTKVLKMNAQLLETFLFEQYAADTRTRHLARKALGRERRAVVAHEWAASPRRWISAMGRVRLGMVRLEGAIQRRLPGWPKSKVSAFGSPTLAA